MCISFVFQYFTFVRVLVNINMEQKVVGKYWSIFLFNSYCVQCKNLGWSMNKITTAGRFCRKFVTVSTTKKNIFFVSNTNIFVEKKVINILLSFFYTLYAYVLTSSIYSNISQLTRDPTSFSDRTFPRSFM